MAATSRAKRSWVPHDFEEDDERAAIRRGAPPGTMPGGPGVGVDAFGGGVVDPTKNVEDLVRAGEKTAAMLRTADQRFLDANLRSLEQMQNFAREADSKLQNFARDAEAKITRALLDAETRRIDQLAQTRQEFQNTIRDMLAESVRTTSTLVSTQLVQIQATFDTRVSKLEAGAFTQAGKQSERDPAISDAITRMTLGLSALKTNTDEMMAKQFSVLTEVMSRQSAAQTEQAAKLTTAIAAVGTREDKSASNRMGQGQVIAWIIGAAMLMAAIATPLIAFLALRSH